MSREFWEERFRSEEFAYGKEPNDFLKDEVQRIPEGRVLALAEGEGRNAVFLAERGYSVVAVDQSEEGLRKATRLADERGVEVELICRDLADFELDEGAYTGIVSIFAHLPKELRARIHRDLQKALLPGGVYLMEAYAPAQLEYGTGGPRDPALLASLEELRSELKGLDLEIAREMEREIHEGRFHLGRSATVQIVARKPV